MYHIIYSSEHNGEISMTIPIILLADIDANNCSAQARDMVKSAESAVGSTVLPADALIDSISVVGLILD